MERGCFRVFVVWFGLVWFADLEIVLGVLCIQGKHPIPPAPSRGLNLSFQATPSWRPLSLEPEAIKAFCPHPVSLSVARP